MTGNNKPSEDNGPYEGDEYSLKMKFFVNLIPVWCKTLANSNIWEVGRKIWMKEHEETIEKDKRENGDPDGYTKVADHKQIILRHHADVLCMLDEEWAQEEHAQDEVERDDAVELGDNCDTSTQQIGLEQCRIKEIPKREKKKFWATKQKICGKQSRA